MGQVITVHSYKGGTGKSIFTINIATSLVKQGNNVVILDMDFNAPSLYTYFPTSIISETSLNDVLLNNFDLHHAIFETTNIIAPNNESSGLMYVGLASHDNRDIKAISRRGVDEYSEDAHKIFNWIDILQEEPYNADFILIDTIPGMNLLSVNSISVCHISLIIMRLLNADVEGTREMITGLHSKLTNKILLVINQLPKKFMKGKERESIAKLINKQIISKIDNAEPELLGVIANDLDLIRVETENMLQLLNDDKTAREIYIKNHSTGPFAESIQMITNRILEFNE